MRSGAVSVHISTAVAVVTALVLGAVVQQMRHERLWLLFKVLFFEEASRHLPVRGVVLHKWRLARVRHHALFHRRMRDCAAVHCGCHAVLRQRDKLCPLICPGLRTIRSMSQEASALQEAFCSCLQLIQPLQIMCTTFFLQRQVQHSQRFHNRSTALHPNLRASIAKPVATTTQRSTCTHVPFL